LQSRCHLLVSGSFRVLPRGERTLIARTIALLVIE
jgi:hypothetical protein